MMVGRIATLKIQKLLPFGAILGEEEILLPKKYLSKECKIGESVEVFIYTDSEDRIIATTLKPYGILGEIVYLEVVDFGSFGVFLDLGIAKDILLPCKNPQGFKKGEKIAVQITKDKEGRLLATQTLKFQKYYKSPYATLNCVPYRKTPLGFECIVEKYYQGMLFENEIFEPIVFGKSYCVKIKTARKDGKLDLKLITKDEAQVVLDVLNKEGGRIKVFKESTPKEIEEIFHLSKKAFKRALFKLAQEVGQDESGIYLLKK